MDVLIKNMGLPKKGHFLFQISANGDVWVSDRNDEGTGIIIAKAIELPPHGELVDRSKMKGAMYEIMRFPAEEACAMYEELIEEAPVVLEATECQKK